MSDELVGGWFDGCAAVAPAMVAVVDAASLRLVRANDLFLEALGATAEQLGELTFRSITPPEVWATVQGRVDALRSGAVLGFWVERPFLRLDGTTFWANLGLRAVHDGTGATRFLVLQALHADDPARAVLDRVGPLLHRTGEALAVVDVETWRCRCTGAPCAAVDLDGGGESVPEASHSLPDIVHPDDWRMLESSLRAAAGADGPDVVGPIRFRVGAAGDRRHIEFLTRRWSDDDRFLTAIVRDGDAAARSRSESGRVHELEVALAAVADTALGALGIAAGSVLAPPAQDALDRLSRREREVVVLLLRGLRVPTIAAQLYVAPSTVRNHLSRVFRKLGVHSQAELVEVLTGPP